MESFKTALKSKIQQAKVNNFGRENYDELRFDEYKQIKPSLEARLKSTIKKLIGYKPSEVETLEKYYDGLQFLWERLGNENKDLLVTLIAYRLLGFTKVKLPVNTKSYWEGIELARSLRKGTDTIDPHFKHFILEHFDLRPIGYDVELYFLAAGVLIDFILEQYAYKVNGNAIVQVENGDIVLDIGGCWGDTALYFAEKTSETGRVFSFEFIPGNIQIFKRNISLNPKLKDRITLIEQPVSRVSGQQIYFNDNGPASNIQLEPFIIQTGSAKTISVDDFVKQNNIPKVDFIKMDIEGAEPMALEGALATIKRFRPKLAIAIYHSMNDFVNIPNWILQLNLGYEIYIDHYTIHSEETVCFAKPATN